MTETPAATPAPARRARGRLATAALGAVVVALAGALTLAAGTGYQPATTAVAPAVPEGEAPDPAALARTQARLQRQLERLQPSGAYIVVDRTHNQLSLRRGADTVLSALCSAGSGATLDDPSTGRQWEFATPRGRFEVRGKLRNPAWRRPDWAFIEAGEPVPTNPADRIEYGALGEFALDFGDGYLIHGTLYERLLGRSVSHGCIRLGRDDLRALYSQARIGTPIFIF